MVGVILCTFAALKRVCKPSETKVHYLINKAMSSKKQKAPTRDSKQVTKTDKATRRDIVVIAELLRRGYSCTLKAPENYPDADWQTKVEKNLNLKGYVMEISNDGAMTARIDNRLILKRVYHKV